MANNGPLIIGAHFNSSGTIDRAFDGLMDELSISSGFLSLHEMQPLLNAKGPTEAPIFMHDTLDPITFSSRPEQLYHLEYSDSLTTPQWETIESFIGGNVTTNRTSFFPPYDPNQRALYRLRTTHPVRP